MEKWHKINKRKHESRVRSNEQREKEYIYVYVRAGIFVHKQGKFIEHVSRYKYGDGFKMKGDWARSNAIMIKN